MKRELLARFVPSFWENEENVPLWVILGTDSFALPRRLRMCQNVFFPINGGIVRKLKNQSIKVFFLVALVRL
jgi:hypothetical protein